MGQAVFAKYHKGLKLSEALEKFNNIISSGANPINYFVYSEHHCTDKEIQTLFKEGSISAIKTISNLGVFSVSDAFGIWSCIKLISTTKTIMIFTAGASEIMYYSFL